MSDITNQRETKHLLMASVEDGEVTACKVGDSCKFWGAGLLHFISNEDLGTYAADLHFIGAGCETCAAPDTIYPDEAGIIMTYYKEDITDRDNELAEKLPGAKGMLVQQLEYMTARNEAEVVLPPIDPSQ